ncbi:hypothetical protein HPP92_008282 [Vanilla planifolia]|uniref:RING-type E3 ubiquitin transferase n=1 Tax=Vanilla planifolia TaxID=51239 RepID=A0A835RD18_VANPL|nr:hypothetical protein HPP92_008282 [Vanilla planifolia]
MVRFSLDEGTGGSKRKKRSTVREGDLVKRRWELGFRKPYTSEDDESEKERDEIEDNGETEDAADSSMCGGSNINGEMTFQIDSEALECSICLDPLCPPIFQCENGHIACSSCCPKLFNKCHVCSSFIGRQRCLALEKVIESIKSQCQYANYGCRATLSFLEKASHEETCCHAALFCPISNCTFSGTKQLLAIHVKTKHCCIVKNFNYDQPFMLTMEKQEPFLLLLGDDDHLFLLLNSHETCSMTALSVICISSNTSKCQFSYELRLHSRGSSLQLRTSAEQIRRFLLEAVYQIGWLIDQINQ